MNSLDTGQNAAQPAAFAAPAAKLGLLGVLSVVALVAVSVGVFDASGIATTTGVMALAVGTALTMRGLAAGYPHPALGLCNIVTFARLVLVAGLLVAVIDQAGPGWGTFILAVIALSLDGVDGWLARNQGLASEFGARFDVEVDAAFALLLAVYAATSGIAEAFVVLLGLPHYLFGLARRVWPWLNGPLPPRFSRKAVCVFQIGTLIAILAPFWPAELVNPVAATVVVALGWSFGRDILWLRRAAG